MNAETGRIVPPAGSTPQPWPWPLWAALLVLFAAALTAHFVFKPSLSISPARLPHLTELPPR